jgi:3-dehydroquinate dehydratase-1
MNFEEFVLAASTASLDDSEVASRHADALELRLDLGDLTVDTLDADLPILVTNRLDSEGGNAPRGDTRIETLCRAIEQPAVEAVDIELAAVTDGDGQRVVEHARAHGVAVVVSTHDFEGTPATAHLLDVLEQASESGDVAKLAVTASDRGDALDVLAATHEATRAGQTVATMAMGEAGRHTRVVAPLYGSRLGYAPLDSDRATAPGQYDLETFRRLYESIRDDNRAGPGR